MMSNFGSIGRLTLNLIMLKESISGFNKLILQTLESMILTRTWYV